jgi:hypothetical protein
MIRNEEKIANWMTALIEDGGPLEGTEPLSFVLVHAAVDQNQRIVRMWRAPPESDALAPIVREVHAQAEADATEMGGMQRYFLKAMLKGKEIGSCAMRFNVDHNALAPAVDSEPATAQGLVAQAQRFSEATMRMFVQGFGMMNESQQKMIASQQSLIDMFQNRQAEMLQAQFELAGRKMEQDLAMRDQEHKHELENYKVEAKAARIDKVWSDLGQYAGPILNWASKGKIPVLPTPQQQAEARLKDMVSTMDETAFQKFLAEKVPEVEQPMVLAVYQKVQQEKAEVAKMAAENAAASQAPRSDEVRKKIEATLLAIGRGIYTRLGTIDMVSLAPIVSSGGSWAALSPEQKTDVSGVATHALAECADLPKVSADEAGLCLWSSILAHAASLANLAPAIMSDTIWENLDADQRLTVFRVANHVLKILPWPKAPPAPGSPSNGHNGAKESERTS